MRNLLVIILVALCALPLMAKDWPQRQGNAQRTGFTTDNPKPPYRLAWKYYFPDDEQKVHPQVQPVIYKGSVLVGTKQGYVYCFDSGDGNVNWKKPLADGPVLNTGAAGTVSVNGQRHDLFFFSALDGCVRAVDIDTGELIWQFHADRYGFCTGPCLAEGKIFIGSRSGTFYCLSQSTGDVLWKHQYPTRIYCTASYSDGRVFFGTEDMVFRCLDSENGQKIWSRKLPYGISFLYFFPVIDGNKVIIRTFAAADAYRIPVSKTYLKKFNTQGKYAPVSEETIKQVRLNLGKQRPFEKNLYVFDAATGKELFLACHSHAGTNDGYTAMPAVDKNGNWYIAATNHGKDPEWWTGMTFMSIDGDTGDFDKWITLYDTKQCNPDEGENFSVGGDILFISQVEEGEAGLMAAFDLTEPKQISIPHSMGWLVGLNFNQQQSGGHAFAISDDRFYHVAFHCLGCWRGTGSDKADKE